MENPSYNDIFEMLSLHCEKALPFFSDGWERFPVGECASRVIADLNSAAAWHETRRPELAKRMRCAIAEIIRREDAA